MLVGFSHSRLGLKTASGNEQINNRSTTTPEFNQRLKRSGGLE